MDTGATRCRRAHQASEASYQAITRGGSQGASAMPNAAYASSRSRTACADSGSDPGASCTKRAAVHS